MKRSPLKRKTPLKAKRPQNYRDPGRLVFRIAVLAKGPCVLAGHGDHVCSGPLDPHHVVEKQTLRKRGFVSELWNPDNGVPVCRKAHDDHTSRFSPLPFAVLPVEALAFAHRLGLSHLINRRYGEDLTPDKEPDSFSDAS